MVSLEQSRLALTNLELWENGHVVHEGQRVEYIEASIVSGNHRVADQRSQPILYDLVMVIAAP